MSHINKETTSYIPSLLFLFAAIVWRTDYYIFSLYGAIPSVIVYCFWYYRKSILSSKYWKWYLLMIVWIYISAAFSNTVDEGLRRMIPITATFLLSFAGYSIVKNNNRYWILYVSYIVLIIFLIYLNLKNNGFSMVFNYANESERNSSMELNANDYAYFTLFATMALKLLFEYLGNRLKNMHKFIAYMVFAGLSFYVALFTASRQVLALQIPLLLFFIYYDFMWSNKSKASYLILIFIAAIIALPYIESLYSDSYLSVRSKVSYQEDVRSELLVKAFDVGVENPILGVGIGAPRDKYPFSHCTYTHLFSRCGFFAFFCFIMIFINSVIDQIKHYRVTNKRVFLLYLVLLLFIAVGNFTFSYIEEPFMTTILFIIIANSERLYNGLIRRKQNLTCSLRTKHLCNDELKK